MKILHVVGARPNFMKAAPVMRALAEKRGVSQVLVHTGQHYDRNMSEVFFQQLDLPEPDINLGVGSGSQASQTAQVMLRFEEVVLSHRLDWVVVYGDVNSTMATAMVAAKMNVRIAHVEAGLRSRDRTMPEEINRLLTDQLADLLLTPSLDGNDNLRREGIPEDRIRFVGNVMIDTLVRLLPRTGSIPLRHSDGPFALVTLHRPSNVDDPAMLRRIVECLHRVSMRLPVLFPVHPRTRGPIEEFGLGGDTRHRLHMMEPMGYLEFLAHQQRACVVITDSGGIQEETTFLRVPCLTVRENTERPITVEQGTNTLVGRDMGKLEDEVKAVLDGRMRKGRIPMLWDGSAGRRIADILTA